MKSKDWGLDPIESASLYEDTSENDLAIPSNLPLSLSPCTEEISCEGVARRWSSCKPEKPH